MSYRDHKVVAFTPFGREVTVSILYEYLAREHERGILDQWQLWMNTDSGQDSDVAYANDLARRHNWITLKDRPGSQPAHRAQFPQAPAQWFDGPRWPKQLNTMRFFVYTQDRDSVYLRFDDDIVFVDRNAIGALVDGELDHPHALACFPIIINNAVCSWHLQQRGRIPTSFGRVQSAHCVDPIGWGSPTFAAQLHNLLLELAKADQVDRLLLDANIQLEPRQQFSVSCFAIQGGEYADLDGVLDWDEEEHWLTMHRPGVLAQQGVHKVNLILGNALVSHFSFYSQRDWLLNNTDLLDRYRKLAKDYQ